MRRPWLSINLSCHTANTHHPSPFTPSPHPPSPPPPSTAHFSRCLIGGLPCRFVRRRSRSTSAQFFRPAAPCGWLQPRRRGPRPQGRAGGERYERYETRCRECAVVSHEVGGHCD